MPLCTAAKRRCIASAMMSAKARGEEPCPAVAVQRCPKACLNPESNAPFCDKTIRKIMTEDCYDVDLARPWRFQTKLQKTFLPEDVKVARLAMALALQSHGHSASWWFRNVVWFDPCASILPGSYAQWLKMRQAAGGDKAWISDDAKEYSRNLRGPKYALSQRTWGGCRVNWFMVLARGRVHVEVMPRDWPLTGAGVALFVARLGGILRRMLGNSPRLPKVVFTDTGTGLYSTQGTLVGLYEEALNDAGYRPYWGADARMQAPDMPDVLLHETAVAMFRNRLRKERPRAMPWTETQAQWTERANTVVRWMNAQCDLNSLCRKFPQRLQELVARQGDRLVRN